MSERPEVLIENGQVKTTFSWDGDRYAHTIEAGGVTLRTVGNAAVETPVFSDLHQQGSLVFLSGACGDRHWSMSVESIEDGLVFDVACRASSECSSVATAYRHSSEIGDPISDFDIEAEEPAVVVSHFNSTLSIFCAGRLADPPLTVRYRYCVRCRSEEPRRGDSA